MTFRQTRFESDSTEATSVLAAIKSAGLDFTTSLRPMFIEDPDALGGIREVDDYRCVVRDDTGATFGPVGGAFTPVHTSAALGWIQPIVDAGEARIISAGQVQGGRRVYVQARLTGSDVDITPGDTVFSSVNFATGHDGSLTVSAGYSSIRVICQNTMAMMAKSLAFKARHTSGVHALLEAAALEFHAQRAAVKGQAERFRAMAKRKLGDKALVAFVRETLSEGAGADDSITVRGVDRIVELAHEAPGATPGTLWGGLNAVTYWASHERGRSEDARQNALLFGTGGQLIERATAVATALIEHLPHNELARESYANHATAQAEFGLLLGKPARIAAAVEDWLRAPV
jgi:phage/plasmid-like protein (TIGR03299 family)